MLVFLVVRGKFQRIGANATRFQLVETSDSFQGLIFVRWQQSREMLNLIKEYLKIYVKCQSCVMLEEVCAIVMAFELYCPGDQLPASPSGR
jgi:hypothetical protein